MRDFRARAAQLCKGRLRVVPALLLLGLGACPPPAPIVPPPVVVPVRQPGLSQFQPDVSRGGRGVAVDISPIDANIALVASESGGVFRTVDGGSHWTRVDSFPATGVSDLHFAPNGSVVLATTGVDGWVDPAVNRAGVWRSDDAGSTWHHVSLVSVCGAGAHGAFGIGFKPNTSDVYVGTDCGLVVSHTLGSSWGSVVFPQTVRSVVPHSGATIDICADSGHFRSTDGGATWPADPTTAPRPTCSVPHSIAVSPMEPGVLFATSGSTLLESDDAGATWTDLVAQPYNERPVWVKTKSVGGGQFDVYFPGLRKRCAGTGPGSRCTAAWARVPDSSLNHDLSDVAFPPTGNCPGLMVIDFGIVSGDPAGTTTCSDGATWNLIGSGAAGYNALQLYTVIGQVNPQAGTTNLYFATMDNHIWGNNHASTTGWVDLLGSEGVALDTPHTAPPIDPKFLGVTGAKCSPCSAFYVPRNSTGAWGPAQTWPGVDPPGSSDPPALIEPKVYVQFKGNDLYMTTDMGSTWTKVATITLARWGMFQVAGPAANPTIYQPVFKPGGVIRLAKISGIRASGGAPQTGTVVDCIGAGCMPAYGAGLSNLHGGCFALPCFGAFGVDPNDADHLVAADAGAGKMKVSHNGGLLWDVDEQLTGAVTMNGRLRFETQPISIYFDRADSSRIFVGTSQAGVIGSVDGGSTWTTFVDTPNVPAVTSVFFDPSENYAYVASYSRGLWRLNLDRVSYQQQLRYVGATATSSILPVPLAATFVNASRTPPLPIANARISFEIGNGGAGCDALTDGNGRAQCTAAVFLPHGTYTLTTRFAGDAQYAPTSIGTSFYRQ
jgi:photosystem II stability/assembly factor-like uncharacterized protein